MGQDISTSVLSRFQRPGVSLRRALAQSKNAAVAAARFHPSGSGRRLSDDYEVQSKSVLGRGSGGDAVVLAYGRSGRRCKYAVKTLDGRRGPRNILLQRAAEVEICLSLDHPHVVRLHDVYESEYGMVYLVMECCTGGELFFRCSQQGRFSERDASRSMAEMLRAVGYLHAHGIAHRDLKPENWLYESSAAGAPLKLIDFGFGEFWDPANKMQTCCGSLNYVSPEVLCQQGYTDKCDLWSLGVIAFLLLTGRPPFAGPEREVRQRVRAGKVDWLDGRPDSPWRGLTPEALDFVRALMQKDPEQRLSAQRAIFHPWIIRADAGGMGSPNLDFRFLQSLRRYAAAPPLQRAVLQLMAQQLGPDETAELRRAFLSLDVENKGAVRLADLKDAIVRSFRRLQSTPEAVGREAPLSAGELCGMLDAFWGPRVSYTDFLAAGMELHEQLQTKTVTAAFRRLDADGSGHVSVGDVQRVFGDAFDKRTVEGWVQEASPKGREVSLDDFSSSLERLTSAGA